MSVEPQANVDLYKHFPLFDGVSDDLLRFHLTSCPIEEIEAEQVLLAPGQNNGKVFLLLSGRLRVHLGSLEQTPLIFLEVGECAGEMSIIEENHASAFVVAEMNSRMLVISPEILWVLIDESHAFARNLLYILSQRLRHNNQLILDGQLRESRYAYIASVDPLTDLYNRRWLDEYLPRQLHRCQRKGEPFSLIMLDLDHFKMYNDKNGHLAGDQALIFLSRRIRDCIRVSDMAVRFGGEEFLLLLPSADLNQAAEVAERLGKVVREDQIFDHLGIPLPSVTISLGVAEMNSKDDPQSLISSVDKALYRAKHKGRDCVSF